MKLVERLQKTFTSSLKRSNSGLLFDRNGNSKNGGRYAYSALEDDGTGVEKLEMDSKVARNPSRDVTGRAARTFCHQQPRYSILDHLSDIGSRIDKNWFIIRDVRVKTKRLMTMLPHEGITRIAYQQDAKEALIELFQAIQHPYIFPVLDMNFVTITSRSYVTTVIPYNDDGTLKDFIYKSSWREDWAKKYHKRTRGIPVNQIQRFGRQILEGLLYLQDRGFPPCGHLHSGNIVLQNGVARLSGLENTLLGFTSRIYPAIRKKLKDNRDAIDSLCFGHVLFEMCAGYELSLAHPNQKNYDDISNYSKVVPVLEYIFGCGDQYPSIEEILCCDFFRNLDLREMRAMPLPAHFQLPYSPALRAILRDVRNHQKQRRKGKKCDMPEISVTNEGGSTPTSSEASTNGIGTRADQTFSAPLQGSKCVPTTSAGVPGELTASPVNLLSLSPEHSLHRKTNSPQRRGGGATSPTLSEVFHTPPHSPPNRHLHHTNSNISYEQATPTRRLLHEERPLSANPHLGSYSPHRLTTNTNQSPSCNGLQVSHPSNTGVTLTHSGTASVASSRNRSVTGKQLGKMSSIQKNPSLANSFNHNHNNMYLTPPNGCPGGNYNQLSWA